MFGFLSRNKDGPIGLDIGSEGVRMLQLTHAPGQLSVAAAARQEYPDHGGESADAMRRRRQAVEAVAEVLRDPRFTGRQVVSCLRGDELAVKNIRLPQMPDSELASAVLWEARERFEFEVAEDRLHYVRAGSVRQGTEVRDEIILIAVAEDTVKQHIEMLSEMQLEPAHIDAEPAALFRAHQRYLRRAEDESAVSVLVDIGLGATQVVVARGTTLVLIKSIDIGGRKFNESVARGLGLDYTEAAGLRRRRASRGKPGESDKPGDQVEWSMYDAIRSQVELLAREIGLCLRYCSVTFRGLKPSEITVVGGEAHDPAVVRLLSECLDCRCAVGEPLRGVEISGVDLGEDRRSVLTEWSVATGLALRDVAIGRRKSGNGRHRIPA